MHNNRQPPSSAANGPQLLDQLRDVSRSDMSLRFQQTAWLNNRIGPMVLKQQDEAQITEFF